MGIEEKKQSGDTGQYEVKEGSENIYSYSSIGFKFTV